MTVPSLSQTWKLWIAPPIDCTANNCLRAIRGAPEDVANLFCSTALGKSPATAAITVTAMATITANITVVSTATAHLVTGIITVYDS